MRTVVIKEAKILLYVAIVAKFAFCITPLNFTTSMWSYIAFSFISLTGFFPCPNFPAFSPDRSRIDTNNEDLERTYVVVSPLAGSDFNLKIDFDRRLTPVRVEPSSY